jgi:UDP-3-O-[3-hydroxymyristoyl] glucosamine N-acyltransferase
VSTELNKRIGRSTKVDNLVQVGRGSRVGRDALLCAQVELAGSTKIGNRVILTGQVGVVCHVKVGDKAIVTPQSGLANDIPPGALVSLRPRPPKSQLLYHIVATHDATHIRADLHVLTRTYAAVRDLQVVGGMG